MERSFPAPSPAANYSHLHQVSFTSTPIMINPINEMGFLHFEDHHHQTHVLTAAAVDSAGEGLLQNDPLKVGQQLDPNKTCNMESFSAKACHGSNSRWRSSSSPSVAAAAAAGEKNKAMKVRRKLREPRFCFQTRSDVDVLDDGYKWRKYGQKIVKNSLHPRSYFRCIHNNCRVKKRVERLSEDCRMVITTYEGRHNHTPPCDDSISYENDGLILF